MKTRSRLNQLYVEHTGQALDKIGERACQHRCCRVPACTPSHPIEIYNFSVHVVFVQLRNVAMGRIAGLHMWDPYD